MARQLVIPNPNVDPEVLCEFCGVELDDGNSHTPGCANEDGMASRIGTDAEREHRLSL